MTVANASTFDESCPAMREALVRAKETHPIYDWSYHLVTEQTIIENSPAATIDEVIDYKLCMQARSKLTTDEIDALRRHGV